MFSVTADVYWESVCGKTKHPLSLVATPNGWKKEAGTGVQTSDVPMCGGNEPLVLKPSKARPGGRSYLRQSPLGYTGSWYGVG